MKSSSFPYSYWIKVLGAAITVLGMISFVIKHQKKGIFDLDELAVAVSWGFLFIFFSRERTDDEMTESLKFKALTRALIISFSATHLFNYVFLKQQLTVPDGVILPISVYQFFALTLLIAICTFYYQKHRITTKGE